MRCTDFSIYNSKVFVSEGHKINFAPARKVH